jgi:dihydroorotate dehydrogenase
MNFYELFKPIAFSLDPEFIHDNALNLAAQRPSLLSSAVPKVKHSHKYQTKGYHISWSFPVGLAAGLDKNAKALSFFDKLGFGAVEFGTVTPKAQYGNPKPRIWRYPAESNLRNAMGFPNQGAIATLQNVKSFCGNCKLGANIGKNKLSDGEQVFEDYASLYRDFAKYSDYLVINVSSPNTPGLRNLQGKEFLEKILMAIAPYREECSKPLFIKIAPDVNISNLEDFVSVASDFRLEGIVATNTTIEHQLGAGGLSGQCLIKKSARIRNQLLSMMKGTQMDLIGVGGISSFEQVKEFWDNGGKFVQVYTSFIFQGPKLLIDIQKGIDDLLKSNGAKNLTEYFCQK